MTIWLNRFNGSAKRVTDETVETVSVVGWDLTPG
jgi:hypothetical protein